MAGGALLLAACGSSSAKTATTSPATTGAAPAATSPAASPAPVPAATVTVSTATVPKLGTVLVNGKGRTLYILSSEQGGKVTCVTGNGCTTFWPPAALPSGVTAGAAGTGAQASLLGTAKDPSGAARLTYGGWPLYTYSGDTGSGQANGEGVVSFGGTWTAITAGGMPATTTSSTPATTSGGSGSGGGY
jgi:predicted lipoprotein with Yx(FWY)xxD motif